MTNIIFFGSPSFSADILTNLLKNPPKGTKIVAVVTNPNKPVGRKKIITPSPVAKIAEKHHLPVYKPEKLNDNNLLHLKLHDPDVFLVVAYGKIIPQNWLSTPKIATLNIHFSLLPKYRGALCVSEPLKNGDQKTGVTLMEMDKDLDHGPIISQKELKIEKNENTQELITRLTHLAQDLLTQDLPLYLNQTITPKPQDHNQATHTPSHTTRTRSSAFISWQTITNALNGKNAQATHNLIRSLNPDPGAWTTKQNQELKIIDTNLTDNRLVIRTVQIPGKNPISWKTFTQNH